MRGQCKPASFEAIDLAVGRRQPRMPPCPVTFFTLGDGDENAPDFNDWPGRLRSLWKAGLIAGRHQRDMSAEWRTQLEGPRLTGEIP